jgi:hydrogenase maturation protease
MGDDGLGAEVIERLSDRSIDAELAQAGTNAFMAMEALDGADRAVIVDALELSEPVGSIWRLEYEDGRFERGVDTTMHDFSVSSALRVGAGTYNLPAEIWLVGAVPASLDPEIGLSEPIRRAVDDVATAACETLDIDQPAEPELKTGNTS